MPDVRCFKVTGDLDLATLPLLKAQFEEHRIDSSGASVVFDLGDCDFIDSAGIAYMVELWQEAQASEGQFGICALSAPLQRIFDVTGLTRRLHVSADLAGAVTHLQSGATVTSLA